MDELQKRNRLAGAKRQRLAQRDNPSVLIGDPDVVAGRFTGLAYAAGLRPGSGLDT